MSNSTESHKETPTQVIRPRSLYTTYNHFNQINDYQMYDSPPMEPWSSNLIGTSPVCQMYPSWRQPIAAAAPPKLFSSTYGTVEEYSGDNENAENTAAMASSSAIATTHGILSLRLNNRVRLDLTTDQALRLLNFQNNIIISMSTNGAVCGLLHPNGRVHQYGSRVEIMASDPRGNHKYAKMWYKGVSFTAENCALVYLVDSAGTRTTTDNFSDLSQDFSVGVFYQESKHGTNFVTEAINALQAVQYWVADDGVENWVICGIRVSQSPDGLVRVMRGVNKYQLRTSPSSGTASLTTPYLHCTASRGPTQHLFVRRGERRMHYDGSSFIVRNAGHSAGFDDKTQLKVY